MSADQLTSTTTPADEMTREELLAEVSRLHGQLNSVNIAHPAVWANAAKLHAVVHKGSGYGLSPESARRALDILGLLIDIHAWGTTASSS